MRHASGCRVRAKRYRCPFPRIRAGVPVDWVVGDKTGTGSYGSANDIAVLWPTQQKPIVLTIFTTRRAQDAEARNDILASATRVVVDTFSASAK